MEAGGAVDVVIVLEFRRTGAAWSDAAARQERSGRCQARLIVPSREGSSLRVRVGSIPGGTLEFE